MKFLACVDLSPVTEAVIQMASRLAARGGAELHLLHVVGGDVLIREYDPLKGYSEIGGLGPAGVPGQDLAAERLRRSRKSMDALADRIRTDETEVTVHLLPASDPLGCILQLATQIQPDLILVGSHGHGLAYHLLLGSTAQGILREARFPVLVVPTSPQDRAATGQSQKVA